MNASRSKSRAKREKAPANPWRSLPRLAALFDETNPQTFFKGSKTQLEELTLTETQLLEQTAALLRVSLAQLIRAGTLMYAKREFLNRKQYLSQAQEQGESSLPRSGSGRAGNADDRVQAAFDALRQANNPITPAKLAIRAKTSFQTATRWLTIHHPELLLQKKDLPPDHSKTTQKAPQPATTGQQPPSTKVIPFVPKKESLPSMQPLEVVTFRELSLPGSHTIALAFGARDSKGVLYFSSQPFPQALDEAIRLVSNGKTLWQGVTFILHQEQHLVPIDWLTTKVPAKHLPFLKRIKNRLLRQIEERSKAASGRAQPSTPLTTKRASKKPAKRVHDPEVEPF